MIFHIIKLDNTVSDTCQCLTIDKVFLVSGRCAIRRKSESIVAIMDLFNGTTNFAFVFRTVVHHRPIIFKIEWGFKVF